jgi:hypothetical protein
MGVGPWTLSFNVSFDWAFLPFLLFLLSMLKLTGQPTFSPLIVSFNFICPFLIGIICKNEALQQNKKLLKLNTHGKSAYFKMDNIFLYGSGSINGPFTPES